MIKKTLLTLIMLLLLTTAAHAKVFLVVATLPSTSTPIFYFDYHEVDNMETCFAIVDNAKIVMTNGGDAEASAIMYCAPSEAKMWEYKERKRD